MKALFLILFAWNANAVHLTKGELSRVQQTCKQEPHRWPQVAKGLYLRCSDLKVFVMLQEDPIGFVDGSGLLFTKAEMRERAK